MPMVDACYLEASQRPPFERAARGPPPRLSGVILARERPAAWPDRRPRLRRAGRGCVEQLELPDLEDPLAYLLGRYRSVGDLPRSRLTAPAPSPGRCTWPLALKGSRFADQAIAAGSLRFSVCTAPFRFGVDDPATRGSCL